MPSFKLALFVLIALASRSSEAFKRCYPCWCYDGDYNYSPGLKVAMCPVIEFVTAVPTELPADIQGLLIYEGSIPRLSDNQFTSYRRLQRIRMVSNEIEQIHPGSLRYLTNLTDIELGSNKISEVSTECFSFSPNLVKVGLQYNKITRLQSHLFSNLKYLKTVYLYNNKINSIEEHCFTEVPQLEAIELHENRLISLDIKFIDNPTSLRELFLQDNPWNCDTSLCGVMDTVVSRGLGHREWHPRSDYFVPFCRTPQNLKYRKWSKPMLTELCSCLPYNCTNIASDKN